MRVARLSAVLGLLGLACGVGPGGGDGGRLPGLPDGGLAPGTTRVRSGATTLAGRAVRVFYPAFPFEPGDAGLLLLDDGQDVEALGLAAALEQGWAGGTVRPLVAVAIPAGDRLQEYGAAEDGGSIPCLPDVGAAPLGTKAAEYERLVVERLVPEAWVMLGARPPASRTGFAGASLGGLSALSTAWGHPGTFGYAGAFSGSFWWRTDASSVQARQDSRIMQAIVRRSAPRPGSRVWLEAGTADETSDRDGDGVIDAIDDTLDLAEALRDAGVAVVYREVAGGTHAYGTWREVLPELLAWAAPP